MQGSLHLCRWHLPFWCPVEALVSILSLWKRHPSSSNPKPVLYCQCAFSKIHIVFLAHLSMKNMDKAWQTRSVLGAQKALVRRKMVQISFLWYYESAPLWTWLFLHFLLVGETNWISAAAALGWYLETTFRSWSLAVLGVIITEFLWFVGGCLCKLLTSTIHCWCWVSFAEVNGWVQGNIWDGRTMNDT